MAVEYEITATAGFDFTFGVSNTYDLYSKEQENPPTLPIPGAGYTLNIPGGFVTALSIIGVSIQSSYTLGLAIVSSKMLHPHRRNPP